MLSFSSGKPQALSAHQWTTVLGQNESFYPFGGLFDTYAGGIQLVGQNIIVKRLTASIYLEFADKEHRPGDFEIQLYKLPAVGPEVSVVSKITGSPPYIMGECVASMSFHFDEKLPTFEDEHQNKRFGYCMAKTDDLVEIPLAATDRLVCCIKTMDLSLANVIFQVKLGRQ